MASTQTFHVATADGEQVTPEIDADADRRAGDRGADDADDAPIITTPG